MAESLLQQLLDGRHFSLDGDDAQFERLFKASTALKDALTARPGDIIPAVLLALDPEAPDDDPLFDASEKALKVEWKTLRNHYKERPRTILQAILLDACDQAALARPKFAAIAWLTAADAVAMLPPTALHEVLRTRWIALGGITEKLALGAGPAPTAEVARAPAVAAVKRPASKSTPHAPEHYGQPLLAAMGPFANVQDQNSWMVHQHPHQWAMEFSKRLSALLVKVEEVGIDLAEAKVAEVVASIQGQVDGSLQAMDRYLRASVASQAARVESMRVQQDALWWSQALYSPSLRRSYRELAPEVAAFVMPLDLDRQVKALAPASVVHLLGETVARLPNAGFAEVDRRLLGAIVDALARHGADARAVVGTGRPPPGRASLLAFLERVVHGEKVEALLRADTGIAPEHTLSLPALAMGLFRAAQARALAGDA